MKRELWLEPGDPMPAHWHVILHQCGDLLANVVWNPSTEFSKKGGKERREVIRGLRSILTLDLTTYRAMLRDPRPWRSLLHMFRERTDRLLLAHDEMAYMTGGELMVLASGLFDENMLYYAILRPVFSQLAPLLRSPEMLSALDRFSPCEMEQHLAFAITYLFRWMHIDDSKAYGGRPGNATVNPFLETAEPLHWLFETLLAALERGVGPDATPDEEMMVIPGTARHEFSAQSRNFVADLRGELLRFDGAGVFVNARLGAPCRAKPSATPVDLLLPLRTFMTLWRQDETVRERTHTELQTRLRNEIEWQAELLQETDNEQTLVPRAELPFAYKLFWLALIRSSGHSVGYKREVDDPQQRHRMFHSPAVLSQIRELWQTRDVAPSGCVTCGAERRICYESACPQNAYCSEGCQYWLHTLNEL